MKNLKELKEMYLQWHSYRDIANELKEWDKEELERQLSILLQEKWNKEHNDIIAEKEKQYKKVINNAKKIKNILLESWLWSSLIPNLDSVLMNIDFHKFNNGIYEWGQSHWLGYALTDALCWTWPIKQDRFPIERIKNSIEKIKNWEIESDRDYDYWQFDYSMSLCKEKDWEIKWFYSREYKGCGNWYYYYLLSPEYILFAERD